MSKRQISSEIRTRIKKIAGVYGFSLVVLFGSYAEGRNRKDSDVDIGYMRNNKLSSEDEMKLARDLALLFGASRADLVYIPDASPLFMYTILENGTVLFEKDSTLFPSLYTYAVKRFQENLPLYKMRFNYLCEQYKVN
jgi:hypothetical protein